MIHEKIFQLKNGREVKVVVKGRFTAYTQELVTDFEIEIKDPREKYFHNPIGVDHPKYWKLKTVSVEQARCIIREYSGIDQRQIDLTVREFYRIARSSVLF